MLQHKIPDSTDWLLESLGGLLAYLFGRNLLRKLRQKTTLQFQVSQRYSRRVPLSGWLWAVLLIQFLALLIWGMGHSSTMPYNVRELFVETSFIETTLLLAVVAYITGAFPVWVVLRSRSGPPGLLFLVVMLMLEGVLAYALLRHAVPMESLYDVVGTPVLGWEWEWEMLGRFAVLHATVTSLLAAAVLVVKRVAGGPVHSWLWLAISTMLLLGDWVVVRQAATDNLVELFAPHRFASMAVGLWFFTVFLSASALAFPWPRQRRWMVLLVLPLSLLFSAFWMSLGLAWNVEKYGKTFSALSFLVSTDRTSYLTGLDLWLRYAVVHLATIGVLAAIQWSSFRFFNASRLSRQVPNEKSLTLGYRRGY